MSLFFVDFYFERSIYYGLSLSMATKNL